MNSCRFWRGPIAGLMETKEWLADLKTWFYARVTIVWVGIGSTKRKFGYRAIEGLEAGELIRPQVFSPSTFDKCTSFGISPG